MIKRASIAALFGLAVVTLVVPASAQNGQLLISRVYYADSSLSGTPVGNLHGHCTYSGVAYFYTGTVTDYFVETVEGYCGGGGPGE